MAYRIYPEPIWRIVYTDIPGLINAIEELMATPISAGYAYRLYNLPESSWPESRNTSTFRYLETSGSIEFAQWNKSTPPMRRRFSIDRFIPNKDHEFYGDWMLAKIPSSKTQYIRSLNIPGLITNINLTQVIINTNKLHILPLLQTYFWTTESVGIPEMDPGDNWLTITDSSFIEAVGIKAKPLKPFDPEPFLSRLFDPRVVSVILKKV